VTHPLTEVREALAFYANKKTTTQEIYMEGGKAAIKALATLDRFMHGHGWQPIESAPRDGTHIIGWSHTYKRPILCWWKDIEKCWESYGTSIFDEDGEHVTHWMPLPEPPKNNR
jgi:hypothetical protein